MRSWQYFSKRAKHSHGGEAAKTSGRRDMTTLCASKIPPTTQATNKNKPSHVVRRIGGHNAPEENK